MTGPAGDLIVPLPFSVPGYAPLIRMTGVLAVRLIGIGTA